MAATPKGGVLIFRGLSSGALYQVPIYNPDVVSTYARLDSGAGTPTSTTTGADFVKFGENVALIDAALVTGIVDTVNLRVCVDYKPTAFILNWASYVNTLATRAPINITFSAGRQISFMSTA